jgi:hypothetical protein
MSTYVRTGILQATHSHCHLTYWYGIVSDTLELLLPYFQDESFRPLD